MLPTNPMDEDRETIVSEIKERVEKGEYTVDPYAVAEAIIRRLSEFSAVRGPGQSCPQHPLHAPS
jgi:Anti-sigma-28 factor, FlgM